MDSPKRESTDNRRQSILVIDHSSEIHHRIDVGLREEGVQIHHALDPDAGLRSMKKLRPDVVLLDLELPGRDGVSVCRAIKDNAELASTIVIFLTNNADVASKVRAFEAGATDYVTKPFDAVELRARVRSALRMKLYLDLLSTRAQIDGLTGLWNRSRFDELLAEEFALWRRGGRPLSLALLDIDHFKRINDTHGHPFGDEVLRVVASTLRASLRRSESAFRYGGEEFAIVFRGLDLGSAFNASERLRNAIETLTLRHGGEAVPVTASIGLSSVELTGAGTAAALIAAADQALYEAKGAGRNRVCRSGGT